MTTWKKLTDELPPYWEYVETWHPAFGKYIQARYPPDTGWFSRKGDRWGYRDQDFVWTFPKFTHWRPLPTEPPEDL